MPKYIGMAIVAAMILLGARDVDRILGTLVKLTNSIKGILPYLVVLIAGVIMYNLQTDANNADIELTGLLQTRKAVIANV